VFGGGGGCLKVQETTSPAGLPVVAYSAAPVVAESLPAVNAEDGVRGLVVLAVKMSVHFPAIISDNVIPFCVVNLTLFVPDPAFRKV
jgi:hypothetical protein